MVRVRFALSAAVPLHIGGARAALFSCLFARRHSSRFVLRMENGDSTWQPPAYEQEIIEDLKWLGLTWDGGGGSRSASAEEGRKKHAAYAQQLEALGAAYRDTQGALRLRNPAEPISINDLVWGHCSFEPAALGEGAVLLRVDGTSAPDFAAIADDAELGVTHVVAEQGQEANAARQAAIFSALNRPTPVFAHVPRLVFDDGQNFLKESSDTPAEIRRLRAAGYLPEAVVNYLALLGRPHPEGREHLALDQLAESFSFEQVIHTAVTCEASKLRSVHNWWMKHLPAEQLAERALPFAGEFAPLIERRGEAFLHALVGIMRGEGVLLGELTQLGQLVFALDIPFSPEVNAKYSSDQARAALFNVLSGWKELLAGMPLEEGADCCSAAQYNKITKALKKRLGVETKELSLAARAGITGRLSAPELKTLVPLITRDVLIERLAGSLSRVERGW